MFWRGGKTLSESKELTAASPPFFSLEHFVLQCSNLPVALLGSSNRHQTLFPKNVATGECDVLFILIAWWLLQT